MLPEKWYYSLTVAVCAASIPVVGFNAILMSEHFGSFLTFGVLHGALAIRYVKVSCGKNPDPHPLCRGELWENPLIPIWCVKVSCGTALPPSVMSR